MSARLAFLRLFSFNKSFIEISFFTLAKDIIYSHIYAALQQYMRQCTI
tara:strand:- start:152 stop:295 length:144 start_codon:yes stop_codon:yes gene_type:complete